MVWSLNIWKTLGWFRFLDTSENPNKNNLFKAQQHLAGT
jgi:hypothetical protein